MSNDTLADETKGREARHLESLKGVVRALIRADASFDALDHSASDTLALFETIWKCNPIGLRAMVDAGVGVFEALATGQAACDHAADWIETTETQRYKRGQPLYGLSVERWLEKRRRNGKESLKVLHSYFHSQAQGEQARPAGRPSSDKGVSSVENTVNTETLKREDDWQDIVSRLAKLWPGPRARRS